MSFNLNMSNQAVNNFWIAKSNFFSSSLFLAPVLSPVLATGKSVDGISAQLNFFDCDGKLVNEVSLDSSDSKIIVLELDQFLEQFKFNAGLQHGRLEVRLNSPSAESKPACWCRIHTNLGASMLSSGFSINDQQHAFFPITISESRSSSVAIVNTLNQNANVTVRLIAKGRTPEVVVEIPALGSRLLSVPAEFSDFISVAKNEGEIQAYLRIRTKAEGFLGIQLIDHTQGLKEEGFFSAVN